MGRDKITPRNSRASEPPRTPKLFLCVAAQIRRLFQLSLHHSVSSFWKTWLHMFLWAVLLLTLWVGFPSRISDVCRIDGEKRVPVHLPWYGHQELGAKQFEAKLSGPAKTLSVLADDCAERLEVDGQICFATKPEVGLHCVYTDLPLSGALTAGEHALRFTIRNLQGESWFDIKEAHGFRSLKVLALLLWGVGAFALARCCGYGPWVGWPVAVAGLLAVQYLDVTTPWVRQHDVEGHREYIDHLYAHRTLPDVKQGWETWQPPLYYIAAAAWRLPFLALSFDDPFRPVQFFAAALYLATIVMGLPIFRRLQLNGLETAGTLALLAFLPGSLFFAGRINNDVLLPVLGAGVMLATAEFVRSGELRWLWCLAAMLAASLATKGSSLAILGGALALVFWAEAGRSGLRLAVWRAYLAGLPAVVWQVFWWFRTSAQTGNPLYVNAALPENLRILSPAWRRLLSFDFPAFINGSFYYDEPMRRSYPTALVTSLLYGEYGMSNYAFRWPELLRWGCLGMLLVLAAGLLVRPRSELRSVWTTCLVLAGSQTAITVAYAVQFPFACNQNMRFFAQAFVPFSCLFGLGAAHFWERASWVGRAAFLMMAAVFILGLGAFDLDLLF